MTREFGIDSAARKIIGILAGSRCFFKVKNPKEDK